MTEEMRNGGYPEGTEKQSRHSSLAAKLVIWVGVFNSIQNICREREIIKREHRTGLHISAYVAADMMGLAVSSVVKSTTTAMTVMPFLLIIQLIFSGSIFPLTGPAQKVSALTISKWGQRVLCIEANLNEIPSVALEQELEELKQFEGMDLLVDLLPDDLIRDMSSDMTYRKIYNYEPDLVTRRWLYLIGFAVAFGAFSILSLEFVDKDRR